MEEFAFLVHPMDINDVAKKYKIASKVSPKIVASVVKRRRPFVLSEIPEIRSATGAETRGCFVVVPLLPWQFYELEEEYVVKKIVKACRVAKKNGAKIVGLGAFTAIPGDGARQVAALAGIPVTTGNTYTVATAIEGTIRAAQNMDIKMDQANLAIVGATGSIGRTCAMALASRFASTVLVGRNKERLQRVKEEVEQATRTIVRSSTAVKEAIAQADVIVTVTGSAEAVIDPLDIKAGAVICDVARPRDIAKNVIKLRDDVLVIDGGVVKMPSPVDFHSILGLPRGLTLACVAETIILALERRYESYTIGKEISLEKVEEISQMAAKHGFTLAGLRSFDQLLSTEKIEQIKANAQTVRRRFTPFRV